MVITSESSDNSINITMDGSTRTSVAGNLSVGNNTIEVPLIKLPL